MIDQPNRPTVPLFVCERCGLGVSTHPDGRDGVVWTFPKTWPGVPEVDSVR